MKQPTETDFETQVLTAGVNVFFKPTASHYSFIRLAGEYVSRFGQLSRDARVRHGRSGDTGEYNPTEVLEMAYQLACRAAESR